ncbi:hypothetical protein BDZ45DRAFT_744116 [Acephala macrosclerotiorum]|nr:hypothetical protein BDZ45DRAFT_744116 [Acephala macrosclerotiorum]
MPFSTIFRKRDTTFQTHKRKFSSSPQVPPPYSDGPSAEQELEQSLQYQSIEATDAPQWDWTEKQCQQWFVVVFVKYLEYSNEEAVKEAKQIKGWGPSVYMRKKDEWIRILGEGKGMAMYSMIYTLRKKGGSLSSENAGFVGIVRKIAPGSVRSKLTFNLDPGLLPLGH